jgi:dTDP-L-rhamnose 4-epimerase
VNTRGTALLLDILVNTKHKVEKVLVASSIGVYGEGAYACATHGAVAPTIRPEQQLAARDWEQHCPHCGKARDVDPDAGGQGALPRQYLLDDEVSPGRNGAAHRQDLRHTFGGAALFNVYGPRQSLSNPYAGVAAIWLSRLLNGKQPVVFEDGGQLRDFVSIHDVVDCLILMLEKPGADYLPVNVGSGETVTILEIASILKRLLGSSIEPQITQSGRKFDIRHNTADITRARETLGFAPKVTLDRGFSELIEWAKTTARCRGRFL